MARLNVRYESPLQTHEGAAARQISPEKQLRRSVLSCLLWEDQFYEDGQEISQRIADLVRLNKPETVAALAKEARSEQHLRHVPLLLLSELASIGQGSSLVSDAIADTIGRADELGELLAVYWRNGRQPVSAQMKKGLARAFCKFDRYQLAKYDRDNAIKLRDVMFMCHPKPANDEQAEIWKGLANGTLGSADTWEVRQSAGTEKKTEVDKRERWEAMLREGKLGYLALLRNLRNMLDAGVDMALIEAGIAARKGSRQVLPFRYVAAARAAPRLERAVDQALVAAIGESQEMPGNTTVIVDTSGSMNATLSAKSQMRRVDAAAALACVINGRVRTFAYGSSVQEVPHRLGMAGVDAIQSANVGWATYLGKAVKAANETSPDRIIVITDEQTHDPVPPPNAKYGYLINVGSYQNGVGYGPWVHIDGWSEATLRFIREYEAG